MPLSVKLWTLVRFSNGYTELTLQEDVAEGRFRQRGQEDQYVQRRCQL